MMMMILDENFRKLNYSNQNGTKARTEARAAGGAAQLSLRRRRRPLLRRRRSPRTCSSGEPPEVQALRFAPFRFVPFLFVSFRQGPSLSEAAHLMPPVKTVCARERALRERKYGI